jgi:hypothetical protein
VEKSAQAGKEAAMTGAEWYVIAFLAGVVIGMVLNRRNGYRH